MFGLGPGELILISLVILVVFGAKKVPEFMGGIGKGIREFKRNMNDVQREIAAPADREALPPGESRSVQHDDTEEKEPKRLM
ncbi:MAG: twin-arginine translocase TatA/TatE family subunit [Gemmatimonadetes bacterium]|jgi:sec-independent protein translocase protein TatA|nr:twin-arginine translocase TatA/TatE family subunit [Gemmatimonadota bacterium]MBM4191218.1 twin-arginine translocase TatA/TatE family subunit [Gemmatimonadota bacterium]